MTLWAAAAVLGAAGYAAGRLRPAQRATRAIERAVDHPGWLSRLPRGTRRPTGHAVSLAWIALHPLETADVYWHRAHPDPHAPLEPVDTSELFGVTPEGETDEERTERVRARVRANRAAAAEYEARAPFVEYTRSHRPWWRPRHLVNVHVPASNWRSRGAWHWTAAGARRDGRAALHLAQRTAPRPAEESTR